MRKKKRSACRNGEELLSFFSHLTADILSLLVWHQLKDMVQVCLCVALLGS